MKTGIGELKQTTTAACDQMNGGNWPFSFASQQNSASFDVMALKRVYVVVEEAL